MQIFITLPTSSKNILINCNPSDLVKNLKERIAERVQIETHDQILNYACKILKDHLPLDSYNINPDSTIHLNLRVKGGMQPAVSLKKGKTDKIKMEEVIKKIRNYKNLLPKGYYTISELQGLYKNQKRDRSNKASCYWDISCHEERVRCVAITHDNKYIVSGSEDKSIKVFELQTGQQVYHFQQVHTSAILTICISHDNRYIFSGSSDNSIKILDIESKQQIHHFQRAHVG